MKKKLKALALSDLHLGEPEGLLFNSGDQYNLIQITVDKIKELSQGDASFENGIEQLILIGDIVDLSEAPDAEAYQNTKVFLSTLVDKIKIDKIVYIPGNHDHHLWVQLLQAYCGKDNYKDCKPKTCQTITAPSLFVKNCLPPNYLQNKVEVNYPFYVLDTDNSFYFFDHGHLFSSTLERFTGAKNAVDIEDLEERTYSFMEWIWYYGKDKKREKIYDWWRRTWHHLKKPKRATRFEEDSAPVYDDYIRSKVIWYLKEICKIKNAFTKDFHFIFGHTHHGGRLLKTDRKFRIEGRFINVWNTGGWLVPSEVFSPDAYIFYIENTKDGLRTDAYKLVSQKEPGWEGDYDRKILEERIRHIG